MTDPIEIILAENRRLINLIDGGRSETMKAHLEMALSFAYGRATSQHGNCTHYAQTRNDPPSRGLAVATTILEQTGYIALGEDAIYVATEKGIKFMEDHYSDDELFGVKIP